MEYPSLNMTDDTHLINAKTPICYVLIGLPRYLDKDGVGTDLSQKRKLCGLGPNREHEWLGVVEVQMPHRNTMQASRQRMLLQTFRSPELLEARLARPVVADTPIDENFAMTDLDKEQRDRDRVASGGTQHLRGWGVLEQFEKTLVCYRCGEQPGNWADFLDEGTLVTAYEGNEYTFIPELPVSAKGNQFKRDGPSPVDLLAEEVVDLEIRHHMFLLYGYLMPETQVRKYTVQKSGGRDPKMARGC
ncbi:uncharacterized protein BDZ99DRAFT_206279 [Mytilinidion resinicola]|uniref:Uncharacterized protein n=1 Tax=Mytilinidion resinicola TaxID=574789 RepID=A0A6A6Y136_9PEZI|nr:uncharacterized protein BDZ99DRAFT_206279 [Mytilinidion resinicola]KAF2802526.1 hypothetical protein BDZ99DRAFT_206279 [Mytilinidion resinicola]